MRKKVMGIVILAVMAAFACFGCKGTPGAKSNVKPVPDTEISTADLGSTDTSSSEKPKHNAEQSKVTITIEEEDYVFPMSFEEFAARGWEYYDPTAGDAWDREVGAGLGANLNFSKGDVKALRVFVYNGSDSTLPFTQCEVIGFGVDYDKGFGPKKAREVVSIPDGSIKINGFAIGEATRADMAGAFGESIFDNSNNEDTFSPPDGDYLYFKYDETGVMFEFTYRLFL